MVPLFDGHNDLLLRLWRRDPGDGSSFVDGNDKGHMDLRRCRVGGFAGGLFATFVPSPQAADPAATTSPGTGLATGEVDHATALRVTTEQAARLLRLEAQSNGALAVCRSVAEVRAAMAADRIAAVWHIEGAEAIGPDLAELDVFHAAGLRSLGPVWSRSNAFGHGVPFKYFTTPDIGPGLTDAGRRLVRACEAKRILLDTAHLNEQGFWDLEAATTRPFVASHANANAPVPSARNLTDRQLDCLRERDGLIGLNLSVPDLRPDCQRDPDLGLDQVVRMFDYLIERVGEDRVGLGSDFDGATIPKAIGDVAGVPVLVEALGSRGYDAASIDKLMHGNWLALLERVWGS
ncbi:MAG: membrane dipeptidase [Pseudomonadota bacterium]